MNVLVEKVGIKKGVERFVLVNQKTGDSVLKSDVSERTMRNYLLRAGESETLISDCFRKARKRFDKSQLAEDDDLDNILEEIGLDENEGQNGS